MKKRSHGGACGSALCGVSDSSESCLSARAEGKLASRNLRCGAHLPLLILLTASMAMAGCGFTSSRASESATPTPTISVSITQNPQSPIPVSGPAFVSATVSNDVANAGVDWVAQCTSALPCGSFSPPHTASGAMTLFTAPIAVPNNNTVAVTALSTTDHSKTASATVTILSTVTGVTITQLPPSSFPSGGNLKVAATVAGDPSNVGVTWKATCGTIDCTSGFNNGNRSLSGAPITFTVPVASATYPMIVGSTVTLTAFATADHGFSATTMFTVTDPISISITTTPPSTLLTGTTQPFIAVVTNDPTNSGVNWTIDSCASAPCGSWAATGSPCTTPTIGACVNVASGAPATYIAPNTATDFVVLKAAAAASPTTAVAQVQISVVAPISIVITQTVLNGSIIVNATSPLVATVSNDLSSQGVDWAVTCASTGTGACGSFSPAHTASGAKTIYTAPATVPTNGTVIITANSTADPTKTASETVTVTAGGSPDGLLTGQWIMLLSGRDANGGPYVLGGAIVGGGIGNITAGNLDLADVGAGPGFYNGGNVSIMPSPASSYTIGIDGRGQIQLALNTSALNGNFGVVANGSGSIILSVVFVTKNHALVSESDAFGSGTGTLDLQNTADLTSFQNGTSGLNGMYSVSLVGAEAASPNPRYRVAAALSLNSSGTSHTLASYIADQSDKGVITSVGVSSVPQSFNSPVTPLGEIALSSVNLGLPTKFNLDIWLIDASHFVVTDYFDVFSGTPPVIIGGYMVAQPSSTAVSGAYAFTEISETASPALLPQAVGGIFTCGSAGTLDVTPLGGTPLNNQPITVACSTPANSMGRGLITFSGAGSTGISQFAEYPTLDQGLFLFELDGGSAGTSGPSGAGVARPQTLTTPIAVSAFSGKYASNFLANTSMGLEAFAGQIISNGVSALSGTADVNSFNSSTPPLGAGTPSLNAALSRSFTAGTNGKFPLVLMITPATGQPAPQFSNINPACYIVDANTCLLLGLDATAPGTGILELQNTGL